MQFSLDCVPCFFKQGLFAARETGCTRDQQRNVVNAIASVIPDIRMEASPPENSRPVYELIRRLTGNDDPFARVKRESNRAAMDISAELRDRIRASSDPLQTGVEIAISGNIIDYGADTDMDLAGELRKILIDEARVIGGEEERLFRMEQFRSRLASSEEVLYLGDNAGEIVFDRVFIEFLREQYPRATVRYVVRDKPVINDATMADALYVGMDKVCEVVSSGSPVPGTVPDLCSSEFLGYLSAADMIISKGQGNYESLSGRGYPVFYLLRVKCPVIAEDIPARMGDICLLQEEGT